MTRHSRHSPRTRNFGRAARITIEHVKSARVPGGYWRAEAFTDRNISIGSELTKTKEELDRWILVYCPQARREYVR